jgi:acylphosphatase
VRNSRDGSVELVAEGDPRAIDELLCWASTGPPHARVDEVEAREAPSTGELNGFIIAPTI